jgi:hypothetical protein
VALIQFTKNHTDHSSNNGYQFEFFCDKCGNGYRSSFQPSGLGMASGLLHGLSSVFGGLGGVASGADHVKDALRGKGWDEAFIKAVEEAKPKFRQCTRCGHWVCPEVCWNEKRSLCEACAPDLQEEAAAVQAQEAVNQLRQKAQKVDLVADVDMGELKQAQCPHCGARNEGGKFCAECGKPMGAKSACAKCGHEYGATAKFCPECGTRRG